MQLTNVTNVPLAFAVWLASDGYDFRRGTRKAISATSLLKSPRQIILSERLDEDNRLSTDVTDLIASRLGHAIHDSIERAWQTDYPAAMKALGYPSKVIDKVVINPKTPHPDMIPVYLEQRVEKLFMGYWITGKFDMILNGELQDFKSTSTFSFTKGSKDDIYQLQGSIYRWLNPDKVTQDHLMINFVFTDWMPSKARQDPSYPQQRVLQHRVELLSIAETETWLRNKITALEAAADLDEGELPLCSDKELWRSQPQFKYYSDPSKAHVPGARSTRNFDSLTQANAFLAEKGKGIIVTVPGQVKACLYCGAFPICSQKDQYDFS